MGQIVIDIKDDLEPYAEDLQYFFQTMALKLYTNRHKGFDKDHDLDRLIHGIKLEFEELKAAIRDHGQFEAAIEAVDVANMAFLVAIMCWHMERPIFDSYSGIKRKGKIAMEDKNANT